MSETIYIPPHIMVKHQKKKLINRKLLYGLFSLVLLVIALVLLWKGHFFSERLYIAVAGPMEDANGKAMVQGVQLAIDQINKQGGIHGKRVQLLKFDDQDGSMLSKEKALEIANSKAVAVIGHYASDASLAATKIYQEKGIPAISGSATADQLTQQSDWYFRVIFNNSDQGTLLAYYVHKVLGYNRASVLFDKDAYGSTLADSFIKTAKSIGLKIKNQWHFDGQDNFKNTLKEVIKTLKKKRKKSGILFLATHSQEAANTIIALQKSDVHNRIIGADALSSRAFLETINKQVRDKNQSGYYTNGIYFTTPFLADLGGKPFIDFKRIFSKAYGDENPSTTAIVHYDAAQVILHALKQFPENKKSVNLTEKREQLKESLWQISDPNVAVKGVTGPIYFDKNGDVDKSISVGVFNKGKPTVVLSQYRQKHWVGSQRKTKNILPEIFQGNLIKANSKFRSKADVVYVGIEFNDISQLKTKESTYVVDFYIWFRFKNDSKFDANKIKCADLTNLNVRYKIQCDFGKVEFVNSITTKDNILKETPMIYKDQSINGNTITKNYRVKAQFKGNFDFHRYPLDHQILPIYFKHQYKTRDTLIYAVDSRGMREGDKLVEKVKANNVFSANGWQVDKISFYEDIQETDSTFGSPRFFDSEHQLKYSRLNVVIEINRNMLSFLLKNIFPNILLVILGYGIFYVRAFSTQVSLGVNLILPTSLLHIRLSSELPTLAYFTFIEYTFYLIYFLAVCSILSVILMHVYEENKERVNSIRFAGRIGYPLIVLMGIILYLHIFSA